MTKKTYFISDLHLGAGYLDSEHERRIVKFLDSIAGDAESLYMLGDILDYWYEYKTVVPRGYIRFFGALARLADAGIRITWLTGNHDIWLFDYLRDEIGLEVIDGDLTTVISGSRFYLAHGDAVGKLKPSFRFIRALFRNRVCQRLYSAIHPRWTVPFAHAWSSHSRMNEEKEQMQGDKADDQFVVFARHYNETHPDSRVKYFVFGHRHIVFRYTDRKNFDSETIILGDWISNFSYGIFDGKDFRIERFS